MVNVGDCGYFCLGSGGGVAPGPAVHQTEQGEGRTCSETRVEFSPTGEVMGLWYDIL